MAFARRISSYRSFLTATSLVLAACGAEDQAQQEEPSFEIEPAVAQAALENPLLVCQQQGFECVSKATDAAGVDACQKGTATCLDGAAKQGQANAAALQKCRETARECVVKGGTPQTCRKDYDACTQAVVPPSNGGNGPGAPGVSLPEAGITLPEAGLPSLPGGGGLPSLPGGGGLNLPEAGLPSLPGGGNGGLPSLPGGGGLNLPEAGLPSLPGGGGLPGGAGGGTGGGGVKCLQDAQTCAAQDPSKAFDCLSAARKCIAGTP